MQTILKVCSSRFTPFASVSDGREPPLAGAKVPLMRAQGACWFNGQPKTVVAVVTPE